MSSIITSRDAIDALYKAIYEKNTESVRFIAQKFGSDFSTTVKQNIMAQPAKRGHLETLSTLLEVWADISISAIDYVRSCAFNTNQIEIYRLLLLHTKNPESLGFTLVNAMRGKKHAIASAILEKFNQFIAPIDKERALLAILHDDRSDLMQLLLQHANTDISASKKGIALYNLSLIGDYKTAAVLLEYSSKEISQEDYGRALVTATRFDNIEFIKFLLTHANKHISAADKALSLWNTIANNYLECADTLIKHCLSDLSDKEKISIGVLAVRRNNHVILTQLSKYPELMKVAHPHMDRAKQQLLDYSANAKETATTPMEIEDPTAFTPRFTVTFNNKMTPSKPKQPEFEKPTHLQKRQRSEFEEETVAHYPTFRAKKRYTQG